VKMGAARSSDTLIGIPPHHYTASQHRRTGRISETCLTQCLN